MSAATNESSVPNASIAVIGCGNLNRSDDGVGSEVIRGLRSRPLSGSARVKLLDAGTDGMVVMFAARGCSTLVIVDASRTGAKPGAVFEVPGGELEEPHQPSLTLHDFRWDHALFAGRKIFGDQFPEDVTVLLIEAATLELGLGLSENVAAAAEQVITRIEQLVADRLGDRTGVPIAPSQVTINRGSVYLPHETYQRYFAGLEGVVLQRREDQLLVLPVRHAPAGGYLIKHRNARGDRVINAGDFFREHGLSEGTSVASPSVWDASVAGLVVPDVFRSE